MPAVLRALPLLALTLVGCANFGDPQLQVRNACAAPEDCVAGVCSESICVSTETGDLEIALRVIPSEDSPTLGSWTEAPFPLVSSIEHDVTLPHIVQIVGTLDWAGDERIPATLTFSRPGLDGRPLDRVTVSTFTEPMRIGDIDADFSARLEAGAMYTVEVTPSPANMPGTEVPWLRELPPMRILQLETPSSPEGSAIWPVELSYPPFDTVCTSMFAGCSLAGTVVNSDADPQEGLQVRAVESSTGRVVSSTALTDADGSFSIVTSPDAEAFVLRVTGGGERMLFPTVSVDPALLPPGETVRIRVPDAQMVTYRGTVQTEGGDGVGATLTFESNDVFDAAVMARGSFRTSTSTEPNGSFEVELLAGTYEIVVSPTAGTYAPVADELRITPPMTGEPIVSGQLFITPERAVLGGTVRTAAGETFPDVQLEAVALGIQADEDMPRAAIYNRSSDATSGEMDGLFDLRLDVGVYDVFVKPPAESKYGWLVMPNYTVGSLRTLANPFEIQPPVPVQGVIRDANGTEIPNAEITVLGRREGGERFVELGRARADENGFYRVLVSPRLAPSAR